MSQNQGPRGQFNDTMQKQKALGSFHLPLKNKEGDFYFSVFFLLAWLWMLQIISSYKIDENLEIYIASISK